MNLSLKDVNLGHILTMLTIVVGLATGWQALNGRVEAIERNDKKQDERLIELSQTLKEVLLGIQSDRLENSKTLTKIMVDVGYLRDAFEELKGASR